MAGLAASSPFRLTALHLGTSTDFVQKDTQFVPQVLSSAFKDRSFRGNERGRLVVSFLVRLGCHSKIAALEFQKRFAEFAQQHEEPTLRFFGGHVGEEGCPATDVIPDKFLFRVHDDLKLLFPVVTEGVGFFIGKEMEKLHLNAQVVEPLVDDFGQFKPEGLIVSGDVSHGMGLLEDVLIAEQGLIRRRIQADDVREYTAMFILEVAEFPGLEILRLPFLDLFQKPSDRSDKIANFRRGFCAIETFFEGFDCGETVFDEFSLLQIVVKFVFFGVQKPPRQQQIELASRESKFNRRRIGKTDLSCGTSRNCL